MATSKATKAQVMENVRGILQENKNLVLTQVTGMDVAQVTTLRANLRKSGVRLKVLKNTLSKRLFKEAGISDLDGYLEGPVTVGFLGADAAASVKALVQMAKKNELLVIKAGYLDGKAVNADGVKAIASLPSREVLLAQLLGTMQGTAKNLLSVLQGNTRKLVYALNAVREKKEKEAA